MGLRHVVAQVAALEVVTQEEQDGHLAESVRVSIGNQLSPDRTASRPGAVRMGFEEVASFVAIEAETGIEAQSPLVSEETLVDGREVLTATPDDSVGLLVHYPGGIVVVAHAPRE